MGKQTLYFGGLPTEMDVKKLTDHFGKPDVGLIPYADLEALLDMPWKSRRFALVVKNWRKALRRELNIDSVIEGGKGVKILTAAERIDVAHADSKSSIRKSRKAYLRSSCIPVGELNDVARKKYDHVHRHIFQIYTANALHEKELVSSLKATEPLPRIAPPAAKAGNDK